MFVTFIWLDVGGCDHFFGWVWVDMTFPWPSVGRYDLFLAGYG